ncbi:MAG: ferredoxin-nitrite reductase [Puniceicoccaceae bacterium 5H]|nr:MAG: ferredoxin-nitrite reductase [Puniceicoccaceae bacterium 5H]
MNAAAFSAEQKQYLEGFFAGVQQRGGMPFLGQNQQGQFTDDPAASVAQEETVFGTPLEDLSKEERIKHEQNGLDVWDKIVSLAEVDQFPEPPDVFRFKFYGLFHVKPAQDSFMLRCRIAGGRLLSHQLTGLAEIAEQWGGGYAHVTTRANLQIREIMPKDTVDTLIKLDELGLTSRGSGADNIRNVTASPTSGFDRQEFLDVMPYARAMHHYILNHRDLYGLPRKFNIAFDSGSAISVCADTNDIGFYATRVGEGHDVAPGVYFRVQLCGITGHQQFASDCGILLKPSEAIPVAAAMVRVFIEHGNRMNRNKARLKYLIDDWGVEKFLEHVDQKLAFPLRRFSLEPCEVRPATDKHGYIGVHEQNDGHHYVGVVTPVGRMTPDQMKGIAALASRYGKGEVRLTVWQNLLIPHVATEDLEALKQGLRDLGLTHETTCIQAGLVACTGNKGCKYSSTDTKGHALKLGAYLSERYQLDQPINIHLTGCPHSCAQHYIGDIGLLGAKVKRGEGSVEGYHVFVGGGVDERQAIGRQLFTGVPFDELQGLLAEVIEGYLEHREPGEAFWQFSRRHSIEELKQLLSLETAAA